MFDTFQAATPVLVAITVASLVAGDARTDFSRLPSSVLLCPDDGYDADDLVADLTQALEADGALVCTAGDLVCAAAVHTRFCTRDVDGFEMDPIVVIVRDDRLVLDVAGVPVRGLDKIGSLHGIAVIHVASRSIERLVLSGDRSVQRFATVMAVSPIGGKPLWAGLATVGTA